jgi:hypothetical protein
VLAPVRTTVPAVLLVAVPEPPRIALILPLSTEKLLAARTPVVPLMAPLVSERLATLWLVAPMSSVPPATVRLPVGSALLALATSAPALTKVLPLQVALVTPSVTVPAVVLVIEPVPPNCAVTFPSCTW